MKLVNTLSNELRSIIAAAQAGDLKQLNPKPARFSATTIRSYIQCPRIFYWPYVAGIQSGSSVAQQFGTEGHSHVEKFLKANVLPSQQQVALSPPARVMMTGLKHLPAPGTPGLQIEQPFDMLWQVSNGVVIPLTGTMDWRVFAPLEGQLVLVGDNKFIAQPKWAMTQKQLREDVQAALYSYVTFVQAEQEWDAGITTMENRWVYFMKNGAPSQATSIVRTRSEADGFMGETISPALDGMEELVRIGPRVGDVAFNKKQCSAYGGCPHLSYCFTGQQSAARANSTPEAETKEETNMGMLSKKPAAPALVAPQTGRTQAAAPNVASAPISKNAILAKANAVAERYKPTDVNPPPPEQEPQDPETAEREAQEIAATVAAKKPRGKKTVAKPEGAEEKVAEVAEQMEQAFASSSKPRGKSSLTPGSNSGHDYWLFVGAQPTKGFTTSMQDIEEIVGAAQAQAAEIQGAEHYRLVKGGYALLEANFAKWLEENEVKGAVRVATPLSPAARDVVGLLRAHARLVIEGAGAL